MERFYDTLLSEITTLGQPSGEIWFRGQSNAAWPLIPSMVRAGLSAVQEGNLLARFRHRAMGIVRDHPSDNDPARWLFLMQHHGLPTRLLDWSESALAALYFAVNSSPASDGRIFLLVPMALNEWQTGERVLFAPQTERCYNYFMASFRGGPQPLQTVATHAYLSNDRLVRQQGAFTVHGASNVFAQPFPASALRSLVISAGDKPALREQLAFFGITRASLFHDLDSLATELREQHGIA